MSRAGHSRKAPRPAARDDGGGSRERMIEATAVLLRRQGYAATGLAQIVDEARAPKGSLYFHFPGGKEELAAAALERAAERWRVAIDAVLSSQPDPALALRGVVDVLAGELLASQFSDGCPLATVALETSGGDSALSTLCRLSYQRWLSIIEEKLLAAGTAGTAGTADVAGEQALFVLSALEGAILLSRVQKSLAPLRVTGRFLEALLSGASNAAR